MAYALALPIKVTSLEVAVRRWVLLAKLVDVFERLESPARACGEVRRRRVQQTGPCRRVPLAASPDLTRASGRRADRVVRHVEQGVVYDLGALKLHVTVKGAIQCRLSHRDFRGLQLQLAPAARAAAASGRDGGPRRRADAPQRIGVIVASGGEAGVLGRD